MLAPVSLLLCLSSLPAAAQPASLIDGGGFERPSLDLSLDSRCSFDTTAFHSGKRSVKITVPPPGPGGVSGGGGSWTISDFQPGATYTISVWARSENVAKNEGVAGGYAYLAAYQYDQFGDYAAYKDFAQPVGTTDWARHTYTFTVTPDTTRLVVPFGLFQASGTFWVDDFTLVSGDKAVDINEIAQAAVEQTEGRKPGIAILCDSTIPVVGTGSDPVYLKELLDGLPGQPYQVDLLTVKEFADRKVLSPLAYRIAVLPYGESFPVQAADSFRRFLRGGGNMLTMGGYALNSLVGAEKQAEKPPGPNESSWLYRIPVEPSMAGNPMAFRGQIRCRAVTSGGFAYLAVYQYKADGGLGSWKDTIHLYGDRDWTSNTYSFKVDEDAALIEIKVGLYQCTGTASFDDISVTDETGKELVSDPGFENVTDPDQARPHHWFRTQRDFGSITSTHPFSGTMCARVKLAAAGQTELIMNTARGGPGDALQVTPEQIGVFDASFPLKRVSYAQAAPDQFILPKGFLVDAPLTGWSSTTVLGYDDARRVPLIEAYDRYGRLRGSVGSITYRYSGHYARSAWAIFGADNFDLFPRDAPASPELLGATVRALMTETFLHNLATNYASYRQGESVEIKLKVSSFGPEAQKAAVALKLYANDATEAIDLPPLEAGVDPETTVDLSAEWKPGKFGASFYRVEAVLSLGGRPWDKMETGFCVWDEKLVKAGPDCVLKDNLFRLNGREQFLQGADSFSFTFDSAHENPLIWKRDFATMRDQAMNLPENLQVSAPSMETPYQWPEGLLRKTDAMVQLAQEYGQVYMPGLLIGGNVVVENDLLEKEAGWVKAFVERYQDVPGIIWYINGDFQLRLDEVVALAEQRGGEVPRTDVERLWNEFLKVRYRSDEELAAAWTPARVTGPLGKVPLQDYGADSWDDVRGMDLARFKVELMRRWINRHVRAIREVDQHHAITSEYYRLPMPGIDIVWAIGDHDCANIGYFDKPHDDIVRFPGALHFADFRIRGKSMSAGEFGCKTHPAWGGGKDYNYHIQRAEAQQEELWLGITHYGWGLGASKIHNWDWKDNVEWIFPWGMVYPGDWVKKDCLDVYRAAGLVFRQFERQYRKPATYVLTPDTHRLGYPVYRVFEATLGAFHTLATLGADIGTLNECALEQIPDEARVIFYPTPYQIPDDVYAKLKAWVEKGGTLYVSGDVSYDALRRRTLTSRLTELCGARFVAERFPNIQQAKETVLAAEFKGKELSVNPAIKVEPAGADVVLSARDGTPVLLRQKLGSGRVCFSTWPLELDDVYAEGTAQRNAGLYSLVLQEAAALPAVVEQTAHPALPVTVPLAAPATHAEVYMNTTDGEQAAASAGHLDADIKLAPNRSGLAVWGEQGRLLALETADQAHYAVYSLDRQDIRRSKRLCVLPLTEGDARLTTTATWKEPVAVVGEVIAGRWRTYETLPLKVSKSALVLSIDGDRRLSIVLVAEKGQEAACAQIVVRSLTRY